MQFETCHMEYGRRVRTLALSGILHGSLTISGGRRDLVELYNTMIALVVATVQV